MSGCYINDEEDPVSLNEQYQVRYTTSHNESGASDALLPLPSNTTPTSSTAPSSSSSPLRYIDNNSGAAGTAINNSTTAVICCPGCGHQIVIQDQAGILLNDLSSLPAGVKFDPTDQEILQHLEAKLNTDHDLRRLHPLIDKFIPTLDDENGICRTHPEKLPRVNKDGLIRHFFHRPSKAYTTGTRKRRKVSTDEEGGETRWHKTGKTRPIHINGRVKGFKKILVLYTNFGRQRKPEKTHWVMHQYHLGEEEEEQDGVIVLSKVFYQTQPRQSAGSSSGNVGAGDSPSIKQQQVEPQQSAMSEQEMLNNYNSWRVVKNNMISTSSDGLGGSNLLGYYHHLPTAVPLITYEHHIGDGTVPGGCDAPSSGGGSVGQMINTESPPHQLIPNFVVQGDSGSSFMSLTTSLADKSQNKN